MVCFAGGCRDILVVSTCTGVCVCLYCFAALPMHSLNGCEHMSYLLPHLFVLSRVCVVYSVARLYMLYVWSNVEPDDGYVGVCQLCQQNFGAAAERSHGTTS